MPERANNLQRPVTTTLLPTSDAVPMTIIALAIIEIGLSTLQPGARFKDGSRLHHHASQGPLFSSPDYDRNPFRGASGNTVSIRESCGA
jgi:hypothetical protein